MHIIQMVGLVFAIYFITLGFLIFYRHKINIRIGNLIFVIADIVFFFFWNYGTFLRGGLSTFMTLDNISPFTFTLIPFTYLLKDKIKDYAFCAIAFLNFGMLVAVLMSPEQAYLFKFMEDATLQYTAEALCHMLCALFGIYLILTDQVKTDFASWRKSLIFMYSVITFSVMLNFVFHKSFFGMDPYGGYSIYFLDIFENFFFTMLAYYLGVLIVLTVGMQVGHTLMRLLDSPKKKHAIATNDPEA